MWKIFVVLALITKAENFLIDPNTEYLKETSELSKQYFYEIYVNSRKVVNIFLGDLKKSVEQTAQFFEKMINSDKSENDSPGKSSRSEDFDKLQNVNDFNLIVAPISEMPGEVYEPVENKKKKCNDRFDMVSKVFFFNFV